MKKYMIIYVLTDGTQKAEFTDDRNDANNIFIYAAFAIGCKAWLYEYDDETDLYDISCRIEPKKRKEINA